MLPVKKLIIVRTLLFRLSVCYTHKYSRKRSQKEYNVHEKRI